MALKTITGKVTNSSGGSGGTVFITLSQSCVIAGTQEVINTSLQPVVAADGTYSVTLQANGDLTPTGSYYTVEELGTGGGQYIFTIVVPQTAGPFVMSSIQTGVLPTASPSVGHLSTLTVDGKTTLGPAAIPYTWPAAQGALQFLQNDGAGTLSWAAVASAPPAAGTLTGTTLAANVVASSLTSVGTLAALAVTGLVTAAGMAATGLTGATAASRYAGATASGAPISGTFAVGDFIIDQTAKIYVCTVAGTPGTWALVGGAAAAAGTLTGGTLAANVLASSLTSVGILASPHMTGAVVDSGGLTVTAGGATITGAISGSSYMYLGPGSVPFTPLAGDLVVSRGGASPGTASIYFGSYPSGGGGPQLYWSGSAFTFSRQMTVAGDLVVSAGANSGLLQIAGGLGVYGHAVPGAQPVRAVTLADVIAVLAGCGLTA